jgi:hypothetical protein
MKRVKYLILLVLIFTSIWNVLGQTKTQQPRVQHRCESKPTLEAKLNKMNFNIGELIELFLTIKNTADYTINLFDVIPARSFDITIRGRNGLLLPLSKEGRMHRFPQIIMHRESIDIYPEKELKLDKLNLLRLYDLNQEGDYTVEVKRVYYLKNRFKWSVDTQCSVSSEPIKFNIYKNAN